MSTLIGKPAGIMIVQCSHCKGDTFKLLCKAPAGTVVGQQFPKGNYVVALGECTSCGEQFGFNRPSS